MITARTLHVPRSWTPPQGVPPGHIGPVRLPDSGRMVWWTGRVAIGLRHEPTPQRDSAHYTQ
ncbi:MAG: hypothetical protein RLZZ618_3466 [Pseudomonadota bacterium]|jgi:hypothetical protein